MKTYKITRVYRVRAESKAIALDLLASDQAIEFLVYESAREDLERARGWTAALKKQFE